MTSCLCLLVYRWIKVITLIRTQGCQLDGQMSRMRTAHSRTLAFFSSSTPVTQRQPFSGDVQGGHLEPHRSGLKTLMQEFHDSNATLGGTWLAVVLLLESFLPDLTHTEIDVLGLTRCSTKATRSSVFMWLGLPFVL